MKITLYICMALSGTIGALGLIYLVADKVRFDSREVGKPWQQHPIIQISVIAVTGILGSFALASLLSPLLLRLGVPSASILGVRIGIFVAVLALLLSLGPLAMSERYLTVEIALKLKRLVAVEAFFRRRLYAWWLPRVLIALFFSAVSPTTAIWCAMMTAFLTYQSIQQRFQTPKTNGSGR